MQRQRDPDRIRTESRGDSRHRRPLRLGLALVLTATALGCAAHRPQAQAPAAVTPEARSVLIAAYPQTLEGELDSILARVVVDSGVDYSALRADPAPLDRWLEEAATVNWQDVRSWGPRPQLAFYLNAYNARLLWLIRDRYPIPAGDSLYTALRRIPFQVARQTVTLESLERDVLWAEYPNPLLHFGLSRAARGGPALAAAAFHGPDVYQELEGLAKSFLDDPRNVQIDTTARVVRLSDFFKDYQEDFVHVPGVLPDLARAQGRMAGPLTFVAARIFGPEQIFLLEGHYTVEPLPYDRALDDRVRR